MVVQLRLGASNYSFQECRVVIFSTEAEEQVYASRDKFNPAREEINPPVDRTSMMAICLTALLALSPAVSFAQGTTTFSGEAVALKGNARGNRLALC